MTEQTPENGDLDEGSAPLDLLIIDDDAPFRDRLGRAMEKRGFEVTTAGSVAEASTIIRRSPPSYAVIDMRLEDGNGLDLVDLVHFGPSLTARFDSSGTFTRPCRVPREPFRSRSYSK